MKVPVRTRNSICQQMPYEVSTHGLHVCISQGDACHLISSQIVLCGRKAGGKKRLSGLGV